MTSKDIRFCERCGHTLSEKLIEHKNRPYCPSCGHIVFLDPKVAAVVLASTDDQLVLVRRAVEPALGRWSFPSGYVDRGEAVEDAAVREVKEETGLDIRLSHFVGLYSMTANPIVLAVYAADVNGGTLRPGDDIQEVALYSPDRLPPLPFPHDEQILADWRAIPPG
jgi:ADP-ribose pyrophosphatase YjhB (NUDIX family)